MFARKKRKRHKLYIPEEKEIPQIRDEEADYRQKLKDEEIIDDDEILKSLGTGFFSSAKEVYLRSQILLANPNDNHCNDIFNRTAACDYSPFLCFHIDKDTLDMDIFAYEQPFVDKYLNHALILNNLNFAASLLALGVFATPESVLIYLKFSNQENPKFIVSLITNLRFNPKCVTQDFETLNTFMARQSRHAERVWFVGLQFSYMLQVLFERKIPSSYFINEHFEDYCKYCLENEAYDLYESFIKLYETYKPRNMMDTIHYLAQIGALAPLKYLMNKETANLDVTHIFTQDVLLHAPFKLVDEVKALNIVKYFIEEQHFEPREEYAERARKNNQLAISKYISGAIEEQKAVPSIDHRIM